MFTPMLLGAVIGGVASYASVLSHYKAQLGPMSVREARWLASMPATPIALARQGLVKLVGTVGSSHTTPSYFYRVPCACMELRHYQVVDSAGGPRRVLTRTEGEVHPFWVEDDTGRITVDPARARMDYEVSGGDADNAVEEHHLRVGERVAVLGYVHRVRAPLTAPMRRAAVSADEALEFAAPPLVTWRSEPEVFPRLRPPAGGVVMSAGSVAMAVLGSLLNL